jgi:hypothetical protein
LRRLFAISSEEKGQAYDNSIYRQVTLVGSRPEAARGIEEWFGTN